MPQCNEAAEKNVYATPNEAMDKKLLCHNVMNESAEKQLCHSGMSQQKKQTVMSQCNE